MNVPTNRNRRINRLNIAFLHQQFLDQFAEPFEVRFREILTASDGRYPFIWTAGHCTGSACEGRKATIAMKEVKYVRMPYFFDLM
jgi:hypothetical protein